MKNLKNQVAVAILMALGALLYSCDTGTYLKTPTRGSLNKKVLTNEDGVEALLTGAYGALDGQDIGPGPQWATPPDNWIYGTVAGGMAHKGSNSGDQPPINPIARMSMNASNGFFNAKWIATYEGVTRANSVLQVADQSESIPDAKKKEIKAEARFLRGHYYFELTKMFGKVPWIDENTTDLKQPNDSLVWSHIEADFQYAYQNLPAVQSKTGKANKWAAAAYLGKTYLFQQKYEKAKQILDKTMTDGVTSTGTPYALVDHFEDNFRASTEQNSETVFDVQYVANDGTGDNFNARRGDMLNYPYSGPTACCGFFQPTQDIVNSFKTNANGLPMPDSYNNAPMVTSDQGVSSKSHFTPYRGNLDPRLDWTVGRRGVPFHDYGPDPGKVWVRKQTNGGPYYALKHIFWKATSDKYRDRNSWAPGTAVNYHIIRYADVILMAAEADANLGNLDQARVLVNKIRERVADDTYGNGWVSHNLNKKYALATVGSQSAMTSLSDASPGDWVIRTDHNDTFQLLKTPASNPDNWQEYKDSNYKISTYPAGSTAFASKAKAIQAVYFERKLELAEEGHRFFDLTRWGEANEKLNAFYQYEGGKLGFQDVAGAHFNAPKNDVYPIPQRQIDLSIKNGEPTLKQNEGY